MTASSSLHVHSCDTEGRPFRSCSWCAGGRLSRVSRVSFTDYLLSSAGFRPFICVNCKRRTLRADVGQLLLLCLCLPVMLVLGMGLGRLRSGTHHRPRVEAMSPPAEIGGDVLTNEDLARLVQAQIPSTVMLRLIDGRPHRFRIDPDSLVSLKKDGVSDEVILTVVTVTLGQPAAPPPSGQPTRSASAMATQMATR